MNGGAITSDRKEWDIAEEMSPEYYVRSQGNNPNDDRRTCQFLLSETFMKMIKIIIYAVTFTGIVSFGVISKFSIILMTSQIQPSNKFSQNTTFYSNKFIV